MRERERERESWSPTSGTGTSSIWWWTRWLAPWSSPATRIFWWSWSRLGGRASAPTQARSRLIRLMLRCILTLWSIWNRGPAHCWGRKEWQRCIYTSCLTRKWSKGMIGIGGLCIRIWPRSTRSSSLGVGAMESSITKLVLFWFGGRGTTFIYLFF